MRPAMRPGGDDAAAILASLLQKLIADRERGGLADLASYQAAYPGYEELVAGQYHRARPSSRSISAPSRVVEMSDHSG